MSTEGGGTKELRLAVVCYGGSSLAIYMHGVTKELHRLVKGSALLEAGLGADEGAPTEAVYSDLLREVAKEKDGVRTFESMLPVRALGENWFFRSCFQRAVYFFR